ncbi:hypothetical protein CC1G_14053 [Coprinopsis cinerea okayama7|uniref:Uncharacterized protein n=1 Tax=Coprinopsis cinerea (strain Okayama-7 / 130 / ATCC MYA-4618 / FGSC 9003) TaxID=240176 RepID=D6RL29_COPC7|nr:hypothetical protein CC1G_14053 [Coprinopsis cinerea okayama7\|eukprot:XP_002912015.1 hypothetical protein CC1G_14053 [Coprinopsis cinerea okayama7\
MAEDDERPKPEERQGYPTTRGVEGTRGPGPPRVELRNYELRTDVWVNRTAPSLRSSRVSGSQSTSRERSRQLGGGDLSLPACQTLTVFEKLVGDGDGLLARCDRQLIRH